MPKIKRYKNNPPLKPNALHRLTKLEVSNGTVDLIVDGIHFNVDGLTLQDMEIIYSQDLEQGEKSLLCFEGGKSYQYNKKLCQWLIIDTENGHIEGGI